MDLGIAGQIAVVTGGSRGIGLAIVRAPADKDIDAQMVVDLRRMLSKAGYGR